MACTSNTKEPSPTNTKKKTPPNIVVIYADDLGYGDVGAYGAINLPTPNMDKFANGGMKFANGYAISAIDFLFYWK